MKEGSRNTILKSIVVLAIIAVFVSLYLAKQHFIGVEAGSGCDFSDTISCSIVNTSKYSELFNVPVAIFGAIWAAILAALALAGLKKPQPALQGLLVWTTLGFLFLFYLIGSEIILKAICPYCTVVHIITLITFGLSIWLYRTNKKPTKKEQKELITWAVIAGILMILPLLYFNIGGEEADYEEFTKCLNDSGIIMYGSFRCGVCAKTRAYFGDAFHNIKEIECHPQGENAQPELCLEIGVERTPTWVLYDKEGNEISRKDGFQDAKSLAEMTGCSLDLIKVKN